MVQYNKNAKIILDGLPPPRRCQALCSTPLQWRDHRSRCDSDKARTSLRCSSPEPGMSEAPRSSTWLSTDADKLMQVTTDCNVTLEMSVER